MKQEEVPYLKIRERVLKETLLQMEQGIKEIKKELAKVKQDLRRAKK